MRKPRGVLRCVNTGCVLIRTTSHFKGPMTCTKCGSILDVVERHNKHGSWYDYIHPFIPRYLTDKLRPWEYGDEG